MEGSPADKGLPKTQNKPPRSKSGTVSPRYSKTSKTRGQSPNLQNEKEKRSASRGPKRQGSPKQQEGKVNQPTLQIISTDAPSPRSPDIPGTMNSQGEAPASLPAARPLDVITSTQNQLCQDQKMGVTQAPSQAGSATLFPTSGVSLAIGISDVPGSEGKKVGSGKWDPDVTAFKQEQQLNVCSSGDEDTAEIHVNLAPVATSYNNLPVVVSKVPVIPATSQPEPRHSIDVKHLPPKPITSRAASSMDTDEAENIAQSEEPALMGSENQPKIREIKATNVPVFGDRQALAATSQAGFTSGANTPNTLATSQAGEDHMIVQPVTKVPDAGRKTAASEDQKAKKKKIPGSSFVPNVRPMSSEVRTSSPTMLRETTGKHLNSTSMWIAATKRGFSVEVNASVTIIILALVALVALVAFLLTRNETKVQQKTTCGTQACKAYSRHLLASINTSFSPCDSFTRYVCDGWRKNHKLSVNQETLEAALGRLHRAVANLDVPDGAQRSFERAAIFYQSCNCVGKGQCDQLHNVVTALAEAGVVWPRKQRSPDVLRTVLFTALQLGWNAVLSFEITSRGNENRVLLRIADEFHLLKRKRDEHFQSPGERRERYFGVLRNLFEATAGLSAENESLVTYEETLRLDSDIFDDLWEGAYLTPVRAIDDKFLFGTLPSLTPERFRDTMRDCGVVLGPDATFVFSTDAFSFMLNFMLLWGEHGEEAMHLFISWWTVQLAALFSNQHLLVNFYGSRLEAKRGHEMFCFSKTFLITGNEVLHGYSNYFLPETLRPAAEELVLDVRHAFHRRVLRWGNYSENATVVHDWNSTAVALAYLSDLRWMNSSGREENIRLHESKPMFKGDSLVVNWRLAILDILDDPTSFHLPEVIQNRDQYLLRKSGEGYPDFALMPYAFTFPYFDQGSTRAFNYAGVGTRVAEALSQLFVDAYFLSESGSSVVQGFITCMQESAHDKLSKRNYARHVEPVSLSTALEAYRANGEALLRDQRVVDLEWLSPEQLIFVAACFTRCTGSEDTGPAAQVQCDDTFKHVPEFATVFRCKPGAPMNPEKKCKLL